MELYLSRVGSSDERVRSSPTRNLPPPLVRARVEQPLFLPPPLLPRPSAARLPFPLIRAPGSALRQSDPAVSTHDPNPSTPITSGSSSRNAIPLGASISVSMIAPISEQLGARSEGEERRVSSGLAVGWQPKTHANVSADANIQESGFSMTPPPSASSSSANVPGIHSDTNDSIHSGLPFCRSHSLSDQGASTRPSTYTPSHKKSHSISLPPLQSCVGGSRARLDKGKGRASVSFSYPDESTTEDPLRSSINIPSIGTFLPALHSPPPPRSDIHIPLISGFEALSFSEKEEARKSHANADFGVRDRKHSPEWERDLPPVPHRLRRHKASAFTPTSTPTSAPTPMDHDQQPRSLGLPLSLRNHSISSTSTRMTQFSDISFEASRSTDSIETYESPPDSPVSAPDSPCSPNGKPVMDMRLVPSPEPLNPRAIRPSDALVLFPAPTAMVRMPLPVSSGGDGDDDSRGRSTTPEGEDEPTISRPGAENDDTPWTNPSRALVLIGPRIAQFLREKQEAGDDPSSPTSWWSPKPYRIHWRKK